MPRRPLRAVPVVIVPGWQGSGEGHWQVWLRDQLVEAGREVRWLDFAELDYPVLADWLTTLRDMLHGLPDDGYDVLTHSLGAVLWLHHVATPSGAPRAARVALVAPPSPSTTIPEIAAFFPAPVDIDTVRHAADGTVLIASDNDPYIPEGIAAAYGLPLKIATTVIPGGGHLNAEAGYGEWPSVLEWCNRDNLAFY